MVTDAKIKGLLPWFGGKRTLAPAIVKELGKHTQYFEPFCGSMAVLMAKEPSQKETVNDLHGDLVNLARVVQNRFSAEDLYDRLSRSIMSEDLLEQAQSILDDNFHIPTIGITDAMVDRAFWYFVASWMGRNGTAGTRRSDYQIAVRWTKNGGSPTVRFSNAAGSIPGWHERLRNVVILSRDAFNIVGKFEDVLGTAIYCDPPYLMSTRSGQRQSNTSRYLHDIDGMEKHQQLAQVLRGYKNARIVVSYYDCLEIRELYEGWTFLEKTMHKNLHAPNKRATVSAKVAPEVLIINGPSYSELSDLFVTENDE